MQQSPVIPFPLCLECTSRVSKKVDFRDEYVYEAFHIPGVLEKGFIANISRCVTPNIKWILHVIATRVYGKNCILKDLINYFLWLNDTLLS